MMTFRAKISAYTRASLGFVKGLLGPCDKVDSVCSRGHTLLKSWTNCPHCKLINRLDALKRSKRLDAAKVPRLALYCLAGANQGQLYLYSEARTTIGCNSTSDTVLTPESLNTQGNFQLLINGKIKITSSDTYYFKLNGQLEQSATLLDFDELELLDNRFLVMDLRSTQGDKNVN